MAAKRERNFLPFDNLLLSKLEIPLLGERIVRRDRLMQRMDEAQQRRVTLVTAPTGYGKTTLLVEWLTGLTEETGRTVWFALDSLDNSVYVFWSYITAGLKNAFPRLEFNLKQMISRGYEPENFAILNPLLNELAQLPHSIFITLDDYQSIHTELVHQSLEYFIDHQPPNVHLILSSRAIPPLSLSRLRAKRQLLEINAQDLAFNLPEASSFLTNVMDIDINAEQIKQLFETTEGWVAGLQLAALSQRGHPQAQPVGIPFSKDNRPILEYLTVEVLNQQDPDIKEFLLKTSILSEMCAPLCDELLEWNDSQEILERIDRTNLFVASFDENGHWFRYHPLFAEALNQQLRRVDPDSIPLLHQKACRWLLEQGYPQKAILHALDAGDLETAAEILDTCALKSFIDYNIPNLVHWFSYFSEETVMKRPNLGIDYALVKLYAGQTAETERLIHRLANTSFSDQASSDQEVFQWNLAVIRAGLECMSGDVEKGIALGQPLVHQRPRNQDIFFYGFLVFFLAESYIQVGNYEAATAYFVESVHFSLAHDSGIEYLHSRYEQARLYQLVGWLNKAQEEYQLTLDYARKANFNPELVTMPLAGLLSIALERCDLETAQRLVQEILPYYRRLEELPCVRNFFGLISASLMEYFLAVEDFSSASRYMEDAMRSFQHVKDSVPNVIRGTVFLQTRHRLALEKQASGQSWRGEGVSFLYTRGELPFDEPIARAWIHLMHHEPALAQPLLEKVLALIPQGCGDRMIRVHLLLALAHFAQGQMDFALRHFQTALHLAEPEGYLRIFVDYGPAVKELITLYLASEGDIAFDDRVDHDHEYLKRILQALETHPETPRALPTEALPEATLLTPQMRPLSPREMEVLEMLVAGKTVKEIAVSLTISVNTAKVHVKNIYRKLGGHSRKVVFDRANKLGVKGK